MKSPLDVNETRRGLLGLLLSGSLFPNEVFSQTVTTGNCVPISLSYALDLLANNEYRQGRPSQIPTQNQRTIHELGLLMETHKIGFTPYQKIIPGFLEYARNNNQNVSIEAKGEKYDGTVLPSANWFMEAARYPNALLLDIAWFDNRGLSGQMEPAKKRNISHVVTVRSLNQTNSYLNSTIYNPPIDFQTSPSEMGIRIDPIQQYRVMGYFMKGAFEARVHGVIKLTDRSR